MHETSLKELDNIPLKDLALLYLDSSLFLSDAFLSRVKRECESNPRSDELAIVVWLVLLKFGDRSHRYYVFFSNFLVENLQALNFEDSLIKKIFLGYSQVTQEIELYLYRLDQYSRGILAIPPESTYMFADKLNDFYGDIGLSRALQRYVADLKSTKTETIIEYVENNEQGFGIFISRNGKHFREVQRNL